MATRCPATQAHRCRRYPRKRTMLPEDARRLPGIIDAPRNAFVFELTPTQTGRRVPRRSAVRSAVEALLTRSEPKTAR